jgi:hypothetical protein
MPGSTVHAFSRVTDPQPLPQDRLAIITQLLQELVQANSVEGLKLVHGAIAVCADIYAKHAGIQPMSDTMSRATVAAILQRGGREDMVDTTVRSLAGAIEGNPQE